MTEPRRGRRGLVLLLIALVLLVVVGALVWVVLEDTEPAPTRASEPESADESVDGDGNADGDGDVGAPTSPSDPAARKPRRAPRVRIAPPAPASTGGRGDPLPPEPVAGDTDESPADATASRPSTPTPEERYTIREVIPAGLAKNSGFGHVVAIDGGLAAVGLQVQRPSERAASVFVYERIDGEWVQAAALASPRTDIAAGLGNAVAVSGGRVAASDFWGRYENVPVVRTYVRADGAWQEEAEIVLPTDSGGARGLALDGDLLAAAGNIRTYVYQRRGAAWSLQEVIRKPATGRRVALDGGTLAALRSKSNRGGVSVFGFERGRWRAQADLKSPGGGIAFGESLALHGDTLVAGFWDSVGGLVVFERADGEWAQSARLAESGWRGPSSPNSNGIAIDGDRIVASLLRDGPKKKATELFVARRGEDGWTIGGIVPPPGHERRWLADTTVAISGDTLLVGNNHRGRRGSAYFIELAPDFPGPPRGPKKH